MINVRSKDNKPMITPSTFDRKRIVVKSENQTKDGVGGLTYTVKYKYVFADGEELEDYVYFPTTTLAVVYGCSQMKSQDDTVAMNPNSKFGMPIGANIVEVYPEGYKGGTLEIEYGTGGKVTGVKDYVRQFGSLEEPSGDERRDFTVTPEETKKTIDLYRMISDIESEILEQATRLHCAGNRNKPFASVNRIIKKSSKNEYQDIHLKVGQKRDKQTDEMKTTCTVYIGDRDTISFEKFCSISSGAHAAVWLSIPSVYVAATNAASVRCTTFKIVCRKAGTNPAIPRQNGTAGVEDLPDNQPFDSNLQELVSESKRVRIQEEEVKTEFFEMD